MNEANLARFCKKGNNKARKELYECFSQQMMGICFRYTADEEVSYDLLHDGFIKAFESFASFEYRGEGSLKAWLSKIFINTALEYLRKKKNQKKYVNIDDVNESLFFENEEEIDKIPKLVLMDFIAKLPDGYRTVFNLYVFEEFSHKEIGEELGISESSSRSQFARAKSALSQKIKEYMQLHSSTL